MSTFRTNHIFLKLTPFSFNLDSVSFAYFVYLYIIEGLTKQLPEHHLTEDIDTHIIHGGVVVCASFPSKCRGESPCGGVCE